MSEVLGTSSSPAPQGKAIDLLRQCVFPEVWKFVPVAGKATFIKEWATRPLSRSELEQAYKLGSKYDGLGVVTGGFSHGLIALDIDGPEADERYKAYAGDAHEAHGEERTMAWTSGRPGRRQLLYRVPFSMVPELKDVKTLILRADGTWACGSGDAERIRAAAERGEYQEVVLRFNQCQSVVPGSVHPETGKRYEWLNYNGGLVNEAPDWILNILRDFRQPQRWLSEEDLAQIDLQVTTTAIPPRQIRGWFFKDEVQARLRPRLEDLIFKHPTFDRYGWKERDGNNPHRMSGCPWHGGESGTAFQYSVISGCWDCKACGVGGDVLDFVHKVAVNDPMAGRPTGGELEGYVTRIATELGYQYPEDLQIQQVKEVPRTVMSSEELLKKTLELREEIHNPGLLNATLTDLAADTGRRINGQDLLRLAHEYEAYELFDDKDQDTAAWFDKTEAMVDVIPGLLKKPSQVMLHSPGGKGKTSACMGLAKAIGRGLTMKVRGIDVPCQQGPVLWIQSDQSPSKLKQDCEDNEIDPRKDRWYIYKSGFQINHVHRLREWINEYKPALVVIDSLGSCSTKVMAKEIEKAYADPLYTYSLMNGIEGGFPAVPIIWVHHNNKSGEYRGNAYLENAVDERWSLRELTDQEREKVQHSGRNPSQCRFIQIHKSRNSREGDLLVVERDENYAFSVHDFTPTERREDNGHGDPEPKTMILRIVKDHALAQRQGGLEGPGMTVKEVWEQLVGEMGGQGRKACSQRTTRRQLDRWVQQGMLVLGEEVEVKGSNKPAETYTLPPTPARAGRFGGVICSVTPSDPLQQNGFASDKTSDTPCHLFTGVTSSAGASEDVPNKCQDGTSDNVNPPVVTSSNPVPEGDLGENGTSDKSGIVLREEPTESEAGYVGDLTGNAEDDGAQGCEARQAGDVGGEVPPGEELLRAARRPDAHLATDLGQAGGPGAPIGEAVSGPGLSGPPPSGPVVGPEDPYVGPADPLSASSAQDDGFDPLMIECWRDLPVVKGMRELMESLLTDTGEGAG